MAGERTCDGTGAGGEDMWEGSSCAGGRKCDGVLISGEFTLTLLISHFTLGREGESVGRGEC